MRLLFLLALIVGLHSLANAENQCTDLPSLLKRSQTIQQDSITKAKKAINRTLSSKEATSLNEVVKRSERELYTASDVAAENKMLRSSGFSDAEIKKLRKENIISNQFLEYDKNIPERLVIKDVDATPLDSDNIKKIRNGDSRRYYLSNDGRVFTSGKTELAASNELAVVRIGGDPKTTFIVKESGELSFDNKTRQYVFKPDYGPEISKIEVEEMLGDVSHISPGYRSVRVTNNADNGVSTFDCLDILSAQSSGKSFIKDRLVADNLVTITALGSSEIMGAGRLDTTEGREVLRADIVGTNLSSLLNATIGQKLALKNANLATSLATRAGFSYAYIKANQQLYSEVLLKTNADQRAESIANFDTVHALTRLPINHYFDKFVVENLPAKIFNACQRGSKARFYVSPRAVRIYERYGSAFIYYGLRKTIVNE